MSSKRYTGFVLVASAALAALAVAVSALGGTAAASATTVTVSAAKPSEFKFALSKKTVAKGVVTFKVSNKGDLRHDFKIAGKKTAVLAPGRSATLRVTLKKAARYPYLCTVLGHAAAGMKGTLVAK